MLQRLLAPVLVLAAICLPASSSTAKSQSTAPSTSVADPLSPAAVRARVEREWSVKADKMRRHLLPLMRKHGVDLWVIMSRENAPDPVVELFGGHGITGWYGHRNAYLFYVRGGDAGLETTVIGTDLSQHLKPFYGTIRSYGQEGLEPHLQKYLAERDAKKIAINQVAHDQHGRRPHRRAQGVPPPRPRTDPCLPRRLVRTAARGLRVRPRRTRSRPAAKATWDILERALSNEVVTPGKTTLMTCTTGSRPSASARTSSSTLPQASTSSASVIAKSCRWRIRNSCSQPSFRRGRVAAILAEVMARSA